MIKKIVSGGQTGVDRAALDVAIELGLPCGGWCPRGRKAEDGPIHTRYPLEETTSGDYRVRTRLNVEKSDGTLILTQGPVTGGTALTIRLAKERSKPCIVVDLAHQQDPGDVLEWVEENQIRILNVAGPRESKVQGIHERTSKFLEKILSSEVLR